MVLGRDRRTAFTADPRDISAWSVADAARALRRARTAQGLRVDEVAQGAGVSAQDLRSIEAAALDRFPDSLSALRTVRRSADYLGLPGDQLALVLMERWPLRASRGPVAPDAPTSLVAAVESDPTATTEAVGGDHPTEVPGLQRGWGTSRDDFFGATAAADPATRDVAIDDVGPAAAAVGEEGEVATGETQAVLVGAGVSLPPPPAPVGSSSRRPSDTDAPPVWLRVVVIAVVLAVLAGVAGIVLHNSHSNNPGTSATPPSGNAGQHATPPTAKVTNVAFTTAQTSPTSADITVGASSFTVTVSAVGYIAWVKVTAPTKPTPLFENIINPGQSQSFPVSQSLTVETGSVAGHVAVTVGTTQVGTYVPPAAPYYITFKAS